MLARCLFAGEQSLGKVVESVLSRQARVGLFHGFDECLRRMPDRDYCRLVRLARGKYDSYHETIDNGKLTIDNEDGGGQEPGKNGKEEEDADGNEEEEHH